MNRVKRQRKTHDEMPLFTRIGIIILSILFISAFYLVMSFTPMSKEEHIEKFDRVGENVEPFRRNLTECARQTRASRADVEHFLKRIPQTTAQGKCFIACILKRNAIITKNKVNQKNLLEANRVIYGEDSEIMDRLKIAIRECNKAVDGIFEICEYASIFNDCMHVKMEHVFEKVTMERRMEALGQMTSGEDWSSEEDEMLKLVKDEL